MPTKVRRMMMMLHRLASETTSIYLHIHTLTYIYIYIYRVFKLYGRGRQVKSGVRRCAGRTHELRGASDHIYYLATSASGSGMGIWKRIGLRSTTNTAPMHFCNSSIPPQSVYSTYKHPMKIPKFCPIRSRHCCGLRKHILMNDPRTELRYYLAL